MKSGEYILNVEIGNRTFVCLEEGPLEVDVDDDDGKIFELVVIFNIMKDL